MSDLVEQLSLIVPAISIGFIIIITSINFYIKIRRKFPITVNCWFCNGNTSVPYTDWNSWHCPTCEQYNGFTEDGDYNCDIPAQRLSKMNKAVNSSASVVNGSVVNGELNRSTPAPTNGLCDPCNRNQELKTQQLASFVPSNESYFDEEVEEFRQQLEQAYRLCPRCERHLKRALNRVKHNILGSKLAQIGSKGLRALDSHVTNLASKMNSHRKRQCLSNICLILLLTISFIAFYKIAQDTNITKAKLDTIFSPSWTATILMGMSYVAALKIVFVNFLTHIQSMSYISQSVGAFKLFTSYVYLTISGNLMGYIKDTVLGNVNFIPSVVAFGPQREEPAEVLNETAVILNSAGCMLSTFVIFMAGVKTGPVLSLLLWSIDMAIPSVFSHPKGLQTEFAVDMLKVAIMLFTTIVSCWNLISRPSVDSTSNDKHNSSFHRIYSECNSDISDESDAETELNTSQQSVCSNRSTFSKRSFRSQSNLNTSLNATRTIRSSSPSAVTLTKKNLISSSTISLHNLPPPNLNRSFTGGSIYNHAPQFNGSPENVFDSRQSCASLFSSVSGPVKHRWSDNFNRNETVMPVFDVSPPRNGLSNGNQHLNESFPSRCSSRNSCYDVPDDFQSGITQLSIGSTHKQRLANGMNRYSFDADSRGAPSPGIMSDLRQRKQLVHPSKLQINESHQRAMATHQTSWVAGGYWSNGTSPQKRNSFQHGPMAVQTNEMFPLLSRTSSQSSGFESHSSSHKNGQENHSNENSIIDEIERDSVFSEPFSVTQQQSNGHGLPNRSLFSGSMNNLPNLPSMGAQGYYQPVSQQLSHPIFPTLKENSAIFLQPQSSYTFGSNRPKSFSTASLHTPLESCHSYPTQPLPSPRYPSFEKTSTVGAPSLVSSSSFNLTKFSKNLPTFKKGSLIRLNQEAGPVNHLNNIQES